MLSNLRSGAMQMMAVGDNILATLVPTAAIDNIGFAFKIAGHRGSRLDGDVGALVRVDIEKVGLHPMTKMWDDGFRQMTTSTKPINTPADLHGFKMRVPPSPISLSLFQDLGAAPMTINAAEMYTGLQTHLVDGQENPLGNIETNKLYQVQKYCSLTNHMWVGYWMLVNGPAWKAMPATLQDAVAEAPSMPRPAERADVDGAGQLARRPPAIAGHDVQLSGSRRVPRGAGEGGLLQDLAGQPWPDLWCALEKYTGPLG